ncbi:hypothetical protein Tco_0764696 [Tanacetum coccineum]
MLRRTLNVSVYHDQILSDEWDIDFLKTTMNIKPNARNKGFSLDEIKATNFELLETSLVVMLDTANDYVRILGRQRGIIVKCLRSGTDPSSQNVENIKRVLDRNPSVKLTNDDATNLTLLFCASVKKAVRERIVPAIDHQKLNHTKAQKVSELDLVFHLI